MIQNLHTWIRFISIVTVKVIPLSMYFSAYKSQKSERIKDSHFPSKFYVSLYLRACIYTNNLSKNALITSILYEKQHDECYNKDKSVLGVAQPYCSNQISKYCINEGKNHCKVKYGTRVIIIIWYLSKQEKFFPTYVSDNLS